MKKILFLFWMMFFFAACHSNSKFSLKDLQDSKIKFDLNQLDKEGLAGPEDGKRALSYEFCIPDTEQTRMKVTKIDPSIVFTRSAGRSMCTSTQVLCLGNTHQPKARQKLKKLSKLDFVDKISETYFE